MNLRALLSLLRINANSALDNYINRDFYPAERRDDDLFLVEFPKSGITWLTFLLANLHLILAGDRRKVTFFNVNDFVPDVHVARYAPGPLLPIPGYRCFKSHASYNRRYKKIFYLVRDPRHVMVSYWKFLSALGWWNGSLAEMVRHSDFGICAWKEHVEGWLDSIDPAVSFTLIRYEDLLTDPALELHRLARLSGLPVNDAIVTLAVARSSIEEMRNSEAEFTAGHPALGKIEFVRRSKTGGSRELIPSDVCAYVEEHAHSLMGRLGYLSESVAGRSKKTESGG